MTPDCPMHTGVMLDRWMTVIRGLAINKMGADEIPRWLLQLRMRARWLAVGACFQHATIGNGHDGAPYISPKQNVYTYGEMVTICLMWCKTFTG